MCSVWEGYKRMKPNLQLGCVWGLCWWWWSPSERECSPILSSCLQRFVWATTTTHNQIRLEENKLKVHTGAALWLLTISLSKPESVLEGNTASMESQPLVVMWLICQLRLEHREMINQWYPTMFEICKGPWCTMHVILYIKIFTTLCVKVW